MSIQTQICSPAENLSSYLAAFEEFEGGRGELWPRWLRALRKSAISHFAEKGFPTLREEEWRYTNVGPLAELSFKPVMKRPLGLLHHEDFEAFSFSNLSAHEMVFLDGHFAPEFSSLYNAPRELRLGSLAAALFESSDCLKERLGRQVSYESGSFPALNTAFFQDGAWVLIPEGFVVDVPIHLLFISTGSEPGVISLPRVMIAAESRSRASIIETHVSLHRTPAWTNAVTEILLEDEAEITHCKIQIENLESFHTAAVQAGLRRGSRFASHSIALGSALARSDIGIAFNEEGSEGLLNGLYLGEQSQLLDHHTVVDHRSPRCSSHEFYHGILGGAARGVFNGKIFVQPHAQKTDAKQTNRALLLSKEASVHTKPQLEIFADDVKCTHGATVGELSEEAIFYLRSRGIPKADARHLLAHAFANEIIARIHPAGVQARLNQWVVEKLQRQG